jgi:predicted RNA-binding Zn ribbon-like protein
MTPLPDAEDEAILLDLLNTTPVVDGVQTDVLAQWSAARDWLRQRAIPVDVEQLHALLVARSLLQDVVRGDQPPSALSTILERVRYLPTIVDSHVQWSIESVDGCFEVAARCVMAWDRLQRSHPPRLRPCTNTECRLFLIDRSKPNTARWCSMAACGNRMKARRHHLRQRTS